MPAVTAIACQPLPRADDDSRLGMEAPAREGRAQVPADGANASHPTVIPAANFFDFADGLPCLSGPLYRAVRHLLPLLHGAVSVGIAEGALDELVALAYTGRQQQRAAVPMHDSETFQFELGRVAAEVRAARAFLDVQARSHWRHALSGALKGEVPFMEGAQTAIWLVTTALCSKFHYVAAGKQLLLSGAVRHPSGQKGPENLKRAEIVKRKEVHGTAAPYVNVVDGRSLRFGIVNGDHGFLDARSPLGRGAFCSPLNGIESRNAILLSLDASRLRR